MNFKMGNMTSRNFIMKLVELVRFDLANKEIMRKSSSQVMSLIVLLVFRLGSSGDMIIWGSGPEWAKYYSFHPLKNYLCLRRIMQYPNPPGLPGSYPERSENDLILGLLVSPGYFFITLVLLVGLALGDESEYGVKLKMAPLQRSFKPLQPFQILFHFLVSFPPDMRTLIVSISDVPLQHVRLPTPPQRGSSRDRCSKRCWGKRSRGRFFKLYTHLNLYNLSSLKHVA